MADRPILFSALMVQALLREARQPGTGKTQTRRVLKPQPQFFDLPIYEGRGVGRVGHPDELWPFRCMGTATERDFQCWARRAVPPYTVGDRLWVRESWRTLQKVDCLKPRDLADDRSKVTYEADPKNRNPLWAFGKRRPSLFMPRWASRLTLLVTDVRVERLQDISEGDAIDEGALTVDLPTHGAPTERGQPPLGQPPSQRFRHLWNSINGPEAWEANPWVAAVTFSVHARNIDQLAPIAEAAE